MAYVGAIAKSSDGKMYGQYPDGTAPVGYGEFAIVTSSQAVDEAIGSVPIQITRKNGTSGAVSVQWGTLQNTAVKDVDYTGQLATLDWADGVGGIQTVYVPIINDALEEGDETFRVVLLNPTNGTIDAANDEITITISANDTPVSAGTLGFTTSAIAVDEDAGTVTATVQRTGGSTGEVTVDYTITAGTATQGSDYSAAQYSGTLTFTDGDSTSQDIIVTLINDATQENDETFTISLSNITGGAGTGIAETTITIRANDGAESYATTSTLGSVAKNGITLTLDTGYEVGQFINGDYFIIDSGSGVVVSSSNYVPTGSGSTRRNGASINPTHNSQGYDGRSTGYSDAMSEDYPVTLHAGDSFIATKSYTTASVDVMGQAVNSTDKGNVASAIVVTVLSAVPYADQFRPPFDNGDATVYRKSDINYALLPSLTITGKPSTATLSTYAGYLGSPWLDHVTGAYNTRRLHPYEIMPNYGREVGHSISLASAAVCLDYTDAEKDTVLIPLLQVGIDLYHNLKNGNFWDGDGGHGHGRKWPIRFAGIMFGNTAMQTEDNVYGTWSEDDQSYYGVTDSANAGQAKVAYWGLPNGYYAPWGITITDAYYQAGCSGGGRKDARPSTEDDDGCVDYRNCCTLFSQVGYCFACLAMDSKTVWNHDPWFDLIRRWMGTGNDPQVIPGAYVTPPATSATFINTLWNTYAEGYF